MSRKHDQTPAEDASAHDFCIRRGEGKSTSCAACGQPVTSSGPTGYRDGEAVCDWCLIEGCHELGLALAVVSVTRAYAGVAADCAEHHREALQELGTFARVYENVAAKSGPLRIIRIPGFTDTRR